MIDNIKNYFTYCKRYFIFCVYINEVVNMWRIIYAVFGVFLAPIMFAIAGACFYFAWIIISNW
ncbi:hypothetical protein [Acinetobacter phage HFM1]|nr:hypothetical protein [Acinetobacter phage HFM1]